MVETKIDDKLKGDITKFDGFKQDTIEKLYDDVADNYDNMMGGMGHPDPVHCAQHAKNHFREAKTVLDMGCGTGLVGQEFVKEFTADEIVGVDASQGMLDVAKTKDCYSELDQLFLGSPSTFPEKFKNRFDVVTCAGCLAEGHLGCEVFEEMVLALKKGGLAIFTTRFMYLEKYGYGAAIKSFED